MAGTKISELTELTTPTGEEELVYAKGGQNGKIKVKNLPSGGGGGGGGVERKYETLSYTGASGDKYVIYNATKPGMIFCCWNGTDYESISLDDGTPVEVIRTYYKRRVFMEVKKGENKINIRDRSGNLYVYYQINKEESGGAGGGDGQLEKTLGDLSTTASDAAYTTFYRYKLRGTGLYTIQYYIQSLTYTPTRVLINGEYKQLSDGCNSLTFWGNEGDVIKFEVAKQSSGSSAGLVLKGVQVFLQDYQLQSLEEIKQTFDAQILGWGDFNKGLNELNTAPQQYYEKFNSEGKLQTFDNKPGFETTDYSRILYNSQNNAWEGII